MQRPNNPTTQRPTLWGGRFSAQTDEAVRRLNDSLIFDSRLWPYDIAGSIAHATMLGEQGIISTGESAQIVAGLESIRADMESGAATLDPTAEDVHTAVEAMLCDRIGSVAGKLHTARSRNDQVATDTRLYLRDAIDRVDSVIRGLQSTILGLAERELDGGTARPPDTPLGERGAGEGAVAAGAESPDHPIAQSPSHPITQAPTAPTVLPGFTHLQHAQPVLLSHHLLAYFWMLQRDRERLADCRKRVNVMPLGAGALAGTSFPINRERVAELLGSDRVAENSMDAVSDRDFAMEFLAAASILMVHVSRFAEELILWNSPEFGYAELDDSVTTGSSIMPQKKNPDVAELARGKSGRVFGDLLALLTVMKGLPLAYNKDMQEDKEPLFDTVDTLLTVLPAFDKMLATARFRRDRMAAALRGDFSTATDLADLLVRKGVPFRDAHGIVGRIVSRCIEQGIALEDLDESALREYCPALDQQVCETLTVGSSIAVRSATGGTAPDAVREQLRRAKKSI